MLYELRVYKIKPKYFPAFVKLSNDHLWRRTVHSRAVGYWVTEMGGVNEVVHLWEYQNLEQRKGIREALAQDAEWMKLYLDPARQYFDEQQNLLVKKVLLPNNTLGQATTAQLENGAYLLTEGPASVYGFGGASLVDKEGTASKVQPLAVFSGLIGAPSESVYTLFPCDQNLLRDFGHNVTFNKVVRSSRLLLNAPWAQRIGCTWR